LEDVLTEAKSLLLINKFPGEDEIVISTSYIEAIFARVDSAYMESKVKENIFYFEKDIYIFSSSFN
jgi:hypothetical protein